MSRCANRHERKWNQNATECQRIATEHTEMLYIHQWAVPSGGRGRRFKSSLSDQRLRQSPLMLSSGAVAIPCQSEEINLSEFWSDPCTVMDLPNDRAFNWRTGEEYVGLVVSRADLNRVIRSKLPWLTEPTRRLRFEFRSVVRALTGS